MTQDINLINTISDDSYYIYSNCKKMIILNITGRLLLGGNKINFFLFSVFLSGKCIEKRHKGTQLRFLKSQTFYC